MSSIEDIEAEEGGSSHYRPGYERQAQKLCQLGLNDEDLAFFFDVDERTIERCKRDHVRFFSAVEAGRCAAEDAAERGTLLWIIGQTRKVKRVMAGKVIELEEYIPPNPHAGLKWLAQRKLEVWGKV
jgi:hypothetical protein